MSADVIAFPDPTVRRDWSTAKSRVLAEGEWTRRTQAEFRRRWQGRIRPLAASAWHHHVRRWRSEEPLCEPENAPWAVLWICFLIAHPAAREGNGETA